MLKISNWLRRIGLAVISLFLIIACTQQPNTTSTSTSASSTSSAALVAATINWIGYSGQYVADKQGFFKDAGVAIQDLFLPNSSELMTAFLAGKVDIGWVTSGDLIQIVEKDPTVKLIYVADYSNGADGIIGRNIQAPQDMKGKTVARENILFEKILLQAYLKKAGLTEADLKIRDMEAGAAGAAFASKQVDAAVTFEPYLTKSAQAGGGKIIFSSRDTNLIADAIVVHDKLLQTRKADLQTYIKAVDKAVKLVNAKDPAALKVVAAKMGVTVEEVTAQLSGIRLFDLAGNKATGLNKSNPNSVIGTLELTAKSALDFKVVSKAIDVQSLYDTSIIESL
jgi:NitT/TauT family transport system substrate-binding protein